MYMWCVYIYNIHVYQMYTTKKYQEYDMRPWTPQRPSDQDESFHQLCSLLQVTSVRGSVASPGGS